VQSRRNQDRDRIARRRPTPIATKAAAVRPNSGRGGLCHKPLSLPTLQLRDFLERRAADGWSSAASIADTGSSIRKASAFRASDNEASGRLTSSPDLPNASFICMTTALGRSLQSPSQPGFCEHLTGIKPRQTFHDAFNATMPGSSRRLPGCQRYERGLAETEGYESDRWQRRWHDRPRLRAPPAGPRLRSLARASSAIKHGFVSSWALPRSAIAWSEIASREETSAQGTVVRSFVALAAAMRPVASNVP